MRERAYRLLRSLERYTKTDMVYLASSGFWLTFEQILLGLVALAVSIAFANFVPKEIYGTYRFLLSVFWALTAFSLTGISGAMSRAVAKGEDGAYAQSIPLAFFGALPMSLIAAGIALYYGTLGNATLAWGAFIICVAAPLFQTSYLFGNYLEGKKDFRRTAYFGIALNVLPALCVLVIMPFEPSPLAYFTAYLGGSTLAAFALSWLAVRAHRPNGVKSADLGNLSWHLSIVNVLSTVTAQLDQMFVFHYLGAAELAAYSFATALPDQIKNMVSNLSNIAFPKFVGRPIQEIRQALWHRIALITIVLVVGIGLYIVVAPLFFRLLLPAYTDSIWYSQLYAVTLLFAGSLIPLTVLQAHAAKRELYIFNIVSSVIQIAAMLAGIILWGLLGLIVARGISRLCNLLVGMALVRSYATRSS